MDTLETCISSYLEYCLRPFPYIRLKHFWLPYTSNMKMPRLPTRNEMPSEMLPLRSCYLQPA